MSESRLNVVVLAAGKGKRMKSDRPKVLHPVLRRPMLHHVLELAFSLDPDSVSVVVGHGEQEVRDACAEYNSVEFFQQKQQLGTADAVKTVAPFLAEQGGRVLVLCGDSFLMRPATLHRLLEKHAAEKADCIVVTADCGNGGAYGRILRDEQGEVTEIREFADCDADQRAIAEINSGLYSFQVDALLRSLEKVTNDNAQGEYYLPDVVKILLKEKAKVSTLKIEDAQEVLGVNDRLELVEAERVLRRRVNEAWLKNGVTLRDPESTTIDTKTTLSPGTEIFGNCEIIESQVGPGVTIEADCTVRGTTIGADCLIKRGSYLESSRVGDECQVGPYAHLRPEVELERGVRIGNFVELKKAILGEGTKASHLSYIGDASVGKGVNIGCGFITCNYDGQKKNRTIIEDDVFVGSDSQTIAPVTIGKGCYVASGSTITKDVPPDSLVFSRGKQVVKEGYALRYRKEES